MEDAKSGEKNVYKKVLIRVQSCFYDEVTVPKDRVKGQVRGLVYLTDSPTKRVKKSEEQTLEMTTEAVLSLEGDRLDIRYSEDIMTGTPDTATRISFLLSEPGLVSITRQGSLHSFLAMEQGVRHASAYELNGFSVPITTLTHQLQNGLHADGGALTMDYTLYVGGTLPTRTKLKLEVLRVMEELESAQAGLEVLRAAGGSGLYGG